MPIAPSNNPPSVTKKNPGSLSTALGVGRSLSAGRGGDGGDGLQRTVNLSPGGSTQDTSFAIGNDQTPSRRSNHTGLLEEGLTLSPVGGFTGNYNLVDHPFPFDWETSFEPLAVTGNIYEPQNELLNEPQRQLSQRQELGVPPSAPSNPTTGNCTTPILTSEHASIASGTPTNQTSPLVRTATKRKAEPEPASAGQNWAVPAPREESRKRSQTGSGHTANTLQNSRKWASRPSPTGGGGGGSSSVTETHTGNGVNHTRSNSSAAFSNTNASNTVGPSGGLASNPTVRRTASEGDEANSGRTPSIMRTTRAQSFPEIPKILPHEKVFPVQIGSELFRLSGASISSDGQSFSCFSFRLLRWLHWDRELRMLEHPHILPSFLSVK
ncbi:MAG: hypothetical protein M1813_003743 [Trichoglossum hirsutum]|jgi:hypothetical protein|nr:MAG: hypothetical protein M1813_003743 [Trichoglossum hirsutum]